MSWTWVQKDIVLALRDEQINEHGGQAGIRDEGLLESALARPLNRDVYTKPSVISLAAAYAYGLSQNHPFLDGNKRTTLVVMELFLVLNGYELRADDVSCLNIIMNLADGKMSEKDLVAWLNETVGKGKT